MTNNEGQPLTEDHYAVLSNAGRCDICGRPIDMSSGDEFATSEFGIWEDGELVDQEMCANAVADALESVGESGADYELARVIRKDWEFGVHESCLDETEYHQLQE